MKIPSIGMTSPAFKCVVVKNYPKNDKEIRGIIDQNMPKADSSSLPKPNSEIKFSYTNPVNPNPDGVIFLNGCGDNPEKDNAEKAIKGKLEAAGYECEIKSDKYAVRFLDLRDRLDSKDIKAIEEKRSTIKFDA